MVNNDNLKIIIIIIIITTTTTTITVYNIELLVTY